MNGNENSQSSSVSKGQWERRLQTDIHTAKQALCDALSLNDDNSLILFPQTYNNNNNKGPLIQPPEATSSSSSSSATGVYASSAENIARLLENWTNKKSSTQSTTTTTTTTASTHTSFNNNPPGNGISLSPSEGAISTTFLSFNSSEGSSQSADQEAVKFDAAANFASGVFQDDECKPNLESEQMPFSLLEKWLFDDASAAGTQQGQDGYFMDMAMGETAHLF